MTHTHIASNALELASFMEKSGNRRMLRSLVTQLSDSSLNKLNPRATEMRNSNVVPNSNYLSHLFNGHSAAGENADPVSMTQYLMEMIRGKMGVKSKDTLLNRQPGSFLKAQESTRAVKDWNNRQMY